ncbi:hypothetical protein Daus18300_008197 [Diaporthe australafricana]|uniref:Uncharacterized protein n=1 Tax=Diaporthe australafricana TaxID=127596 RepID=A0ABR3WJR3_9PEZI
MAPGYPVQTALQGIATAILDFHTDHPALSILLFLIYASGVLAGSILLCSNADNPRAISWLPHVFLTDGILVCCCPLATVLPIFLWPLVIVYHILRFCLRWFLAAPTFCGIRREVIIRPYRACARGLRRWGRDRRARKQRRGLLPVTNSVRDGPRAGYGAINGSRPHLEREQNAIVRSQHVCFAHQPPSQSDMASVRSIPPPYQE